MTFYRTRPLTSTAALVVVAAMVGTIFWFHFETDNGVPTMDGWDCLGVCGLIVLSAFYTIVLPLVTSPQMRIEAHQITIRKWSETRTVRLAAVTRAVWKFRQGHSPNARYLLLTSPKGTVRIDFKKFHINSYDVYRQLYAALPAEIHEGWDTVDAVCQGKDQDDLDLAATDGNKPFDPTWGGTVVVSEELNEPAGIFWQAAAFVLMCLAAPFVLLWALLPFLLFILLGWVTTLLVSFSNLMSLLPRPRYWWVFLFALALSGLLAVEGVREMRRKHKRREFPGHHT